MERGPDQMTRGPQSGKSKHAGRMYDIHLSPLTILNYPKLPTRVPYLEVRQLFVSTICLARTRDSFHQSR